MTFVPMMFAAAKAGLAAAGASGTLATIGTVMQGVGSVVGALQERQTARYNKAVTNENMRARQEQADIEAIDQRRKSLFQLGAQSGAVFESGLGGSASGFNIMRSGSINAERDALNVRYNAALDRTALSAQSRQYGMEAKQAGMKAFGSAVGTAFLAGSKMGGGAVPPPKSSGGLYGPRID